MAKTGILRRICHLTVDKLPFEVGRSEINTIRRGLTQVGSFFFKKSGR